VIFKHVKPAIAVKEYLVNNSGLIRPICSRFLRKMASNNFKSTVKITHIGTATAILEIDGITFLTDPAFCPGGTEWDFGGVTLMNTAGPAIKLEELPPIDAVLLSHEDHPDNLDELGRGLLNGRTVLTTMDGASKLAPRPGVRGMKPWEKLDLQIGDKVFEITATPCEHLPGGEVIGFVLTTKDFGETGGLPNAIYFSGDTIYLDELVGLSTKFHISLAMLNIGAATVRMEGIPPFVITLDGKSAAKLLRAIKADMMVPMHFESWRHFAQNRDELANELKEEGVMDKVCWLEPGVQKRIFN
jgi:L-ascorbate metabolism protein UlaG (beta-lactamase superfamily)